MSEDSEMIYTQMQNSIKAQLLTLNQAKKLVMQVAGISRPDNRLGDAVAAISAEIGALEYQLESNRVTHDNPPKLPDESASSNFDVSFPPPKKYD